VVHPQPGATSTNSSLLYYLLSIFLHAHSIKILLCIGQEICAHLARSSFPELGHNTKPSYSLHISFLQSLALSSASVQHSMHKAFILSLALSSMASQHHHIPSSLHRLDIYLYITKGPKHG
jgi:hypothetical protein